MSHSGLCRIRGNVVRHYVAFGLMSFGIVLFGLMSFGVMSFGLLSVYRASALVFSGLRSHLWLYRIFTDYAPPIFCQSTLTMQCHKTTDTVNCYKCLIFISTLFPHKYTTCLGGMKYVFFALVNQPGHRCSSLFLIEKNNL